MESNILPDDKDREDSLDKQPPRPVSADQSTADAAILSAAVFTVIVGAGAFVLVASSTGRTHGATRSQKLEWQQRQLEIEQAERNAKAADEKTF